MQTDHYITFTSPNGRRKRFGPFSTKREAENAVFLSKLRLSASGLRDINKWQWRIHQ